MAVVSLEVVGKIAQLSGAGSDLWAIANALANSRIVVSGTGVSLVADLGGLGQYVLEVVVQGSVGTRAEFDALKSLVAALKVAHPGLAVQPMVYRESE